VRWGGRKVQEVEDIPEDIENKWDSAVDDVEDSGDWVDNAYDKGRNEQRYDDDRGKVSNTAFVTEGSLGGGHAHVATT